MNRRIALGWQFCLGLACFFAASLCCTSFAAEPTTVPAQVLKADDFKHYVDHFNTMEKEPVVNLIPNSESWEWMKTNVPTFECPDKDIEEIYWFRWWSYRKAFTQQPDHISLLEFTSRKTPVSSAVGHHVMEGRWLHDNMYINEMLVYWLGEPGQPVMRGNPGLMNYSGWLNWSAYQRYLVNGDKKFLLSMLDNFIAYYNTWETKPLGGGNRAPNLQPRTQLNPDGSFWSLDVRDAMEESISGSRTARNVRPTLNSYMYGNAMALVEMGKMANRPDVVETYTKKAEGLRKIVEEKLWDKDKKFFMVKYEDGTLCDAREEIGFIPWYFNLPEKEKGYEAAWAQLIDPQGFWAPLAITTAEQRHPRFRFKVTGGCEWNGPGWPYATAQTLTALANVLNSYPQNFVSKQNFLDSIKIYAKSTHDPENKNLPYIGEYFDEQTGKWLRGDKERGRYYNHSTFCDLVINDLIGLRPRGDDTVEVNPLIPAGMWDYFCLDDVRYHGKTLTIVWDKTGTKYNKGVGLTVLADGKPIAHSAELTRVTGPLK